MKTVRNPRQFSKEDWKNPFGLALIGYYLVMAVVGLLIPDDILKANAWAREFSDFMASVVPQIDRITALGIKPDVNRFYFSVLWATNSIAFILGIVMIFGGRKKDYPMWTTPIFEAAWRSAGISVLLLWSQMLWAVAPSLRLTKLLFSTDIGRGVVGQLVFSFAPTLLFSLVVVVIGGWLSGYIPRRIKEQKNG